MIKVIHVDEETVIQTTRAILKAIPSRTDPLVQKWIGACREFGVNAYVRDGEWVFVKPV